MEWRRHNDQSIQGSLPTELTIVHRARTVRPVHSYTASNPNCRTVLAIFAIAVSALVISALDALQQEVVWRGAQHATFTVDILDESQFLR